jgi:hypothetical protein
MSRGQPPADSADADSADADSAEATVSREQVRRLADLARLDVEEGRLEALTGDLRRLIEHAQQLGEVDTAGVSGPSGRRRSGTAGAPGGIGSTPAVSTSPSCWA